MMIDLLVVAFCLILFGLIVFLLRTIAAQFKAPESAKSPYRQTPNQTSKSRKIDYGQTQRESELYADLHHLVYGDNSLAHRLISQVRVKHPGKSMEWCIQKAIRDLEWDRSR